MRGLSGPAILNAWEAGQGRRPVQRALAVLRSGFPDRSADELGALSIGQRDGLLFALREGTFGGALPCFAECPRCAERLELSLRSADFRTPAPTSSVGELQVGGARLRFRLPNSHDLAAIEGMSDPEQARLSLLDRCVIEAEIDGEATRGGDLPAAVASLLAERMAEMDPGADLVLSLTCPSCAHAFEAPLDLESFFWAEIAAQARRLLGEVHTLARAYGWAETKILRMSPTRRQAYLEMVGA